MSSVASSCPVPTGRSRTTRAVDDRRPVHADEAVRRQSLGHVHHRAAVDVPRRRGVHARVVAEALDPHDVGHRDEVDAVPVADGEAGGRCRGRLDGRRGRPAGRSGNGHGATHALHGVAQLRAVERFHHVVGRVDAERGDRMRVVRRHEHDERIGRVRRLALAVGRERARPRGLPADAFAELLDSVREGGRILRGEAPPSRRHVVAEPAPDVAAIRERLGLSQSRFALLFGISPRTLQGWEQGRRAPKGAERTLLRVADAHPEALLELVR